MARRPQQTHLGRVERTEWLSPHMIRIVLGGEGLSAFTAGAFSDHYIKIHFPRPGVPFPQPFDIGRIREELPRAEWPVTRTYTVRQWDAEAGELTVDFVHHGDEGVAGPWAAQARPGDEIHFGGPGGGYVPSPGADWYLLAGDESALPAIAVSLERLPEGATAQVFIEVSGPEEEQKLATTADARITWLHRGADRVGDALVRAVSGFDFPAGSPEAFVHGEAGFVKELRRLLRVEHGIPMDQLSISGYWRTGHDEDGWQSTKRDWNRSVEEEQER